MSTIFDDKFLAVANNLIDKFGVSATITVKGDSVYDPITGVATVAEADTVITVSPPLGFDQSTIDGINIQHNDYKLFIKNEGVEINATDEISVNGKPTSIINVKPIYSGEDVAIYQLHCRR